MHYEDSLQAESEGRCWCYWPSVRHGQATTRSALAGITSRLTGAVSPTSQMRSKCTPMSVTLTAASSGTLQQVHAALDSAGKAGLKVILSSANVGRGISVGNDTESVWWPFVLTTMSAGRTRQHEAESILHDRSDIGADVPDEHAINHRAWAIGRKRDGSSRGQSRPGTGCYHAPHGSLPAQSRHRWARAVRQPPVCSLVVVARTYDYDSTPPDIRESVVAVKVLTCDSFPDREAYRVFSDILQEGERHSCASVRDTFDGHSRFDVVGPG